MDDDYTSESSDEEIEDLESDKQSHMGAFNNLRKHRRVPSITMSPSMYQTVSFFDSSSNSLSMNGNTQIISPASRHLSKQRRCKSKDSFNIHKTLSSNTINALLTSNNNNQRGFLPVSPRVTAKEYTTQP